MASPHAQGLDEHHHLHHVGAPPNVTTVSFTHTPAPAHGCPPSPTALAAASTLATLADGRPLHASHAEYDDDDDDDDDDGYGGGIAITSADVQEHTAAGALADTYITEQDMVEQLQSAMFPHAVPTAMLDAPTPIPSHQMPAAPDPMPHVSAHTSSSDPALEPLQFQPQETIFSTEENVRFAPITAFFHHITPLRPTVPGLDLVEVPGTITRDQLQGDRFDPQGIDWTERNTTRSCVRAKRAEYEATQLPPGSYAVRKYISPTPNSDNLFRFTRNNTTHLAVYPHFQLRNVLAATSRNDLYYAAGHQVCRTDAEGSPADVMIEFNNCVSLKCLITTIDSTDSVLVAGGFDGEYAIADLTSTYGAPCTFGQNADLTRETKSRIVNHMHLFESRTSYRPQAVICSNDNHMRVIDCATNRLTHSFSYPNAVNCSATSPDGRMRVVVGDFKKTLITNAETGQPFETLHSHTEDAFACAWADDGIHVATAAQDSSIVIWDARFWGRPVTTLCSQLSVPRSLRFSPVGSGPRVLIAAEADDYINVINAQTFNSKQVFDFFGPIAGVTFTPDGQSLFIANGERRFGGIIELERTGWAERTAPRKNYNDANRDDVMTDWAYDDQLSTHDRTLSSDVARERRCVDFGSMIV